MADFYLAEDNSEKVKAELEKAIETAMNAVGTQAVSRAVTIITNNGSVDTGLLRNSITYALGGKPPKKSSYHASKASKYGGGGKGKSGSYSGSAPADQSGEHTVYIGTNVYYAPYIEYGTVKMSRRAFLQPAVEGYKSEYQAIFEKVLKGK